jgi:hypothetical protein
MAASSIHRRLNRQLRAALAGLLVSAAPVSAWACATCGCSLSADAANGHSVTPGWRGYCKSAFLIYQFLKNKHRIKIAQTPCNQAWHHHGW